MSNKLVEVYFLDGPKALTSSIYSEEELLINRTLRIILPIERPTAVKIHALDRDIDGVELRCKSFHYLLFSLPSNKYTQRNRYAALLENTV